MSLAGCSSPRFIGGSLLCAAVSLFATSTVHAGLLGDRNGATLDYLGITEGSYTDPLPLFGSPALIAPGSNLLTFNPTSFAAATTPPASGVDITDGTLSMQIVSHPGESIKTFSISEAGGYSLIDNLTNTGLAKVSAALLVVIDYQAATGGPFVPFTASYSVPVFSSTLPPDEGVLKPWSLSLNLDFSTLLPGVDLTQIKVTLNNQLIAQSESGAAAFIDKKSFVINSTSSGDVPEPTTLGLLGIASFGLLARRRKA